MLTQTNGKINKLDAADRSVHDWYRFVLSFPPHLVRGYLEKFGVDGSGLVLDPFCGTGTTIVECKKQGIASIGIEANPMAHFASTVKTSWSINPGKLITWANEIADSASGEFERQGIADVELFDSNDGRERYEMRTLPAEQMKLLLKNSISPRPLHKTLILRDLIIGSVDRSCAAYGRLALAKSLVEDIGNLHFGPEVGVGVIKEDAPVIQSWLANTIGMARDLETVRPRGKTEATVLHGDARDLSHLVRDRKFSVVFTSPPYPNEKDYTRTTRLESVLLGFINDKSELRRMKQHLIRSNTRNIYQQDRDEQWVKGNKRVQDLADKIEARRIELGKTSGFERLYARVTRSYFGGMYRHLADLRDFLKPGAWLGYVVGDQASYLRIMIRTGQILGEIAEELGYRVESIDLFRTRLATATREQLNEEVLVLRWPG
ncbi:MAG: DNA methylase [candidate division BRC1 bacterium ADurb.BinA292]|nr:MAG: DNA methylase [candidate division BRC1 bacterium ADurb.BinA292]